MAFNDSQLHLNVPLTDLAVAFRPDEDGLLWNKLLPPKVVPNTSNIIRQIDRANLMSIQEMKSGANGWAGEVQFKVGADQTYACIDYACEVVKDRRERANADAILEYDAEQLYTGMIKVNNLLEYVGIKGTLRVSTNYDSSQVVTLTTPDQWDNYNSPQNDPVSDIKTGVLQVRIQTGGARRGKIIVVMHDLVWNAIQLNPNLLARSPVHPSGGGIMTLPMFQEIIFGKPGDPNYVQGEIITTSAFYNTAADPQTADMRSFVGPDVMIIYSELANVRNFGFGQSFMFAGVDTGIEFMKQSGGIPLVVYSYPDPKRGIYGSDVDRIVGSVDFKVLNPLGGYLIKECVDKTNTALYSNWLNN